MTVGAAEGCVVMPAGIAVGIAAAAVGGAAELAPAYEAVGAPKIVAADEGGIALAEGGRAAADAV